MSKLRNLLVLICLIPGFQALAEPYTYSHESCDALVASRGREPTIRETLKIQSGERNGAIYNCFVPKSNDPCLVLMALNLRPLALGERMVLQDIERGRMKCEKARGYSGQVNNASIFKAKGESCKFNGDCGPGLDCINDICGRP